MKVRSIGNVPVLKSLPLLGLVKKAMYTLYIAHNSMSEERITFQEFELNFYNSDIEIQKKALYDSLTMRLTNVDDCIEVLEIITPFVYDEFDGKEVNKSIQTINSLEDYKDIMKLILNNVYEELIRKKSTQL